MCKSGSTAACEQLGTAPKPPGPGPVFPPGTGKVSVTDETEEPDQDSKGNCAEYYERCVAEGGERLLGHASGYTRCGSCLRYCASNGFWPEAIYTWNGVRLPCPGI